MTEKGPKRVQSVNRAMDVIEHLARNGQSSLADLRVGIGLSNSTLLRIFSTLQDRNRVHRLLAEGRYELPISFGNMLGSDNRGLPLTKAASPHLIALQKKIGWPSDIAIPLNIGKMEILETTRIKGPLAPNRTSYGVRPSMVQSALGRAYLSFCKPQERKAHLDRLAERGDKQDRAWLDGGRFDAMIASTQKQGYGVREKDYWVEPIDFGPDVNAIAAPVLGTDGFAVASINVIWIREIQSLDQVVAKCFAPLNDAAKRVAADDAALAKV